jgi:hypothetical protein
MPYDKKLLERYAMQAAKMSQEANSFAGSVNINDLGNALGLAQKDSFALADYLKSLNWVTISSDSGPMLTITPKGFEEIAKLHWPLWKKWLDRHPKIVAAFLGGMAGLVANLILRLF